MNNLLSLILQLQFGNNLQNNFSLTEIILNSAELQSSDIQEVKLLQVSYVKYRTVNDIVEEELINYIVKFK